MRKYSTVNTTSKFHGSPLPANIQQRQRFLFTFTQIQ